MQRICLSRSLSRGVSEEQRCDCSHAIRRGRLVPDRINFLARALGSPTWPKHRQQEQGAGPAAT